MERAGNPTKQQHLTHTATRNRLSRVEENAGSATVALSADERAELDHLTETIRVAGNRYNDAGMAMVGR